MRKQVFDSSEFEDACEIAAGRQMTTPPNHNTADQSGAMQPTSSASSKCFAADGVTPVFSFPGEPLMVRAVDFNRAIAAIVPQVVQAPSNGAVKTATKVFQSIFFNVGLDGESAYEQMQRAMRAAIISSEYVAAPTVATVPSEFKDQMLSLCDAQRIDQSEMACCDTCSGLTYNDACDDLKRKIRELAAPSPTEQASVVRNADCYSHNDGDSWCDCPDDIVFVHGLKVGDEYEVLASTRAWTERYRVTKAPDDTSDDYEVELVSAPAAKGNAQDEVKPTYTTGHCEYKKQQGGCPHHNLQCGYPDCDRKPQS